LAYGWSDISQRCEIKQIHPIEKYLPTVTAWVSAGRASRLAIGVHGRIQPLDTLVNLPRQPLDVMLIELLELRQVRQIVCHCRFVMGSLYRGFFRLGQKRQSLAIMGMCATLCPWRVGDTAKDSWSMTSLSVSEARSNSTFVLSLSKRLFILKPSCSRSE
jgi:hypothetical protein